MKYTTVVIVVVVVTGIFASALFIPQLFVSQSSNAVGYYPNRNLGMSSGMGWMMVPSMTGSSMIGDMPMMKGTMGYYSEIPTPLSHDKAIKIAADYLVSLNTQDLVIDEFEEYSHNFYVSLIEKSTGIGAIEIIIDRHSGSLQPEPQSMMWNSKYGIMGDSQKAEMTVTPGQALKIAQDFLNSLPWN